MSDSVRPHRRQPTRPRHPWDSPGKNTEVGCHFLLQCVKVKSQSEVTQSCPTLSDPMDHSPPGSSVYGIFQAKVLQWGAIAFSAGGTSSKEPTCQFMRHWRHRFNPWVGNIPWRRKWQPTPVFLPGECHGQRRLAGYSSWSHIVSDMTDQLTLTYEVQTWEKQTGKKKVL